MKTLFLDEDFTVQGDATQFDTRGDQSTAAGLTGGEAFFAMSEGADPINPALVLPMAERSGRPGRYYADFDAALLATHLAVYSGMVVWQCARFPGNKADWRPVRVRDRR